ncbi:MAG: magnesium chelatase subunit ChlI family protein [Candidatus Limnocylindrales bacterium]
MSGRALRAACGLGSTAEVRAIRLAEHDRLSARGTERLLRVARTVADLEGDQQVGEAHLAEAARFRSPGPGEPPAGLAG